MQNTKKMIALTGGHAVGEAIRQIDPEVMAVYPITPQTPIVEYFAKKVAMGKADTEIIQVESEHSALSACIGAAAAGARSITASASQGILYMMEVLPIAAAMRLPIVMAVANRAISGPLNIHGDHSDAMMMRETGWIQLFSDSAQEAYDNMLIGLKLAEKTMLPLAVNLDGFNVSHTVENIQLLSDAAVKGFIGQYAPKYHLLDFEKPVTFGAIALPNSYFGFRRQIAEALEAAEENFLPVAEEFAAVSGRKYDLVEEYHVKGAETVIVALGATAGTIKDAVDALRGQGKRVGLLKVRLFRPFPYAAVKKALACVEKIIVMDKHLALGTRQVLAGEVQSAIGRSVESVVYGLGGREVFQRGIEEIFAGKAKAFLE